MPTVATATVTRTLRSRRWVVLAARNTSRTSRHDALSTSVSMLANPRGRPGRPPPSMTLCHGLPGGGVAGSVEHALRHRQRAQPPGDRADEEPRFGGRGESRELLPLSVAEVARATSRFHEQRE